jgi:antitoxin HigA-1
VDPGLILIRALPQTSHRRAAEPEYQLAAANIAANVFAMLRSERLTLVVLQAITPGEILLTEFLEPLGISQYRLAQATGLPQTRISEIVHGRRRITPNTGLRLSRALGLSERYWINMQTDYDIETEHDLHEVELRQVEVLVSPAA